MTNDHASNDILGDADGLSDVEREMMARLTVNDSDLSASSEDVEAPHASTKRRESKQAVETKVRFT